MKGSGKDFFSTLIIILINVLIVGFGYLFLLLINYSSKIDNLFLKIALYIIICIIIFQINKRFQSRILNIIAQIIYLPITILALFTAIAIPVLSIQISLYLYLALSFLIPMIAYRLDQYYQITVINLETWIYLVLTVGVIFAFLLHNQIKFVVDKTVVYFHNGSKRIQHFKLIELNDYIISLSNIKFIIFFLYLIYLIIVNVMTLQNTSFYENPNIDKAVLQSFVTFVAFDRVLSTIKLTEFRPSKLLEILKNSFKHLFEQ
ncbi:hypothetical protein [Flavobacterium soyae]|uniref:Uncharacterized protein n=1 Tax=Flavobacterium soyae TaxID=2903098 RepID=A0ABZ2UKH2_9FLAO|nr:hypothetical protein [Flavobacterium soyae]MCD9575603.1 hypothetical protein [Flavobacterium soyae]